MTERTTKARITTVAAALLLLGVGVAAGWGIAQWQGGQMAGGHGAAGTSVTTGAGADGKAPAERRVLYWYDPMVPSQRFDKPGKSPFMDMQLVPRYADEGAGEAAAGGAGGSAAGGDTLRVSTQARQALGLRLAPVEQRSVAATVDAVGTVQLNERDISIVQARTAGFVERVYPRAPGDLVAAGAPLVDLMNPDWLGAEQEYLAILATGDTVLAQAARQRLVLLGIPAALIDRVTATRKPVAVQTVTAPSAGVISELVVRNGMTVSPGMTLVRINGLAMVWLEVAVPEALAGAVSVGQPVTARFAALPGEPVTGKVAAVLPQANADSRSLRVRIELPNPARRLVAGMYAQVSLRGPSHDLLTVPSEAVIRTGKRALVYLAESPDRYRPVEVEVGDELDDRIVVRSGLTAGQQVVASGQFLIDSEASLQGVMARAAGGAAAANMPAAASAAAPGLTSTVPASLPRYRADGTVLDIDSDEIMLEHGPVPALKWPAMTMPFKLADKALTKGLKAGDRISFEFVQQGDEHTVTGITRSAPGHTGAHK